MSADGPGEREVAHRLFAAEFDDADLSYAESDEERAPNYVVTPTGVRANRLFVAGVLTEVESVSEEVLRARVVDPSGAFVAYAGQYQPDALAFLERTDPPAFVAVTGKARTFRPEDSDRVFTSVRPERISVVDAETRDRWIVDAAEATLARVATAAEALSREERGEPLREQLEASGVDSSLAAGIPLAFDHYETTPAYLDALRRLALDALAVVADQRDAVRALDLAPDEGDGGDVGPIPADVGAGVVTAGESGDDGAAGSSGGTGAESAAPAGDAAGGGSAATDAADGTARTGGTSDAEAADGVDPTVESDGSDRPEAAPGTDTADTGATDRDDEESSHTDAPADSTGSTDAPAATADDSEAGATAGGSADLDDLGDFDGGSGATGADPSEGDGADGEDDLYELDEEERRSVEEEYGTDFETGTEVDDPGEADIDVPTDPEEIPTDDAAGAGGAPDDDRGDAGGTTGGDEPTEPTDDAGGATDATRTETAAEGDADAPAGDVDLESAVVDAMNDLDDGDGADRAAVVEAVVDAHDATAGDVEDAIEDALMSGLCYEPGEDRLKAI